MLYSFLLFVFLLFVLCLACSLLFFCVFSGYYTNNYYVDDYVNGELVKRDIENLEEPKILIENVDIIWEAIPYSHFLVDNSTPIQEVLLTERTGYVHHVSPIEERNKVLRIPGVFTDNESGLLGLALHPNFNENKLFYIYYTTIIGGEVTNQVVRYRLTDNIELTDRKIILDGIPAGSQHDGGRIAFGQDGYLYIATGDSDNPSLAQDLTSLAGKILRITDDGEIPSDNPYVSNAYVNTNNIKQEIYSYGHRNPQGLAWDSQGNLWSTEHGPIAHDKINKIVKGGNYGWGLEGSSEFIEPYLSSGIETWAPSGAAILNDVLYFGSLRGESLFELDLKDPEKKLKRHLQRQYGRLRAVQIKDGKLFLGTSNRDGYSTLRPGDDKLLVFNMFPYESI
jgi:Glucose/sorbosone dehydrogenases